MPTTLFDGTLQPGARWDTGPFRPVGSGTVVHIQTLTSNPVAKPRVALTTFRRINVVPIGAQDDTVSNFVMYFRTTTVRWTFPTSDTFYGVRVYVIKAPNAIPLRIIVIAPE